MFEVSVEQTFAAGHALREYKGKCENVHGHNYRVQLVVQGGQVNRTGLLMDFGDMKRALREVMERLDHQFINDIPPFDRINPSAENIAKYFYEEVEKLLALSDLTPGAHIAEVKLWETDVQYAVYRPE